MWAGFPLKWPFDKSTKMGSKTNWSSLLLCIASANLFLSSDQMRCTVKYLENYGLIYSCSFKCFCSVQMLMKLNDLNVLLVLARTLVKSLISWLCACCWCCCFEIKCEFGWMVVVFCGGGNNNNNINLQLRRWYMMTDGRPAWVYLSAASSPPRPAFVLYYLFGLIFQSSHSFSLLL